MGRERRIEEEKGKKEALYVLISNKIIGVIYNSLNCVIFPNILSIVLLYQGFF